MLPRFQRFLKTKGILGKVRCHTGKGTCHRPRTGWVHLMISYCGRMAILGYFEIQLFYALSYQSLKQTNKRNSERKERKKEKETKRVKNVIFKGMEL